MTEAIIEAVVNDKYFTNHKFTVEAPGVYAKKEYRQIVNYQTQQRELLERVICFKIYETDPELGTNVEFYIDNRLQESCYFMTRADFEKRFTL